MGSCNGLGLRQGCICVHVCMCVREWVCILTYLCMCACAWVSMCARICYLKMCGWTINRVEAVGHHRTPLIVAAELQCKFTRAVGLTWLREKGGKKERKGMRWWDKEGVERLSWRGKRQKGGWYGMMRYNKERLKGAEERTKSDPQRPDQIPTKRSDPLPVVARCRWT